MCKVFFLGHPVSIPFWQDIWEIFKIPSFLPSFLSSSLPLPSMTQKVPFTSWMRGIQVELTFGLVGWLGRGEGREGLPPSTPLPSSEKRRVVAVEEEEEIENFRLWRRSASVTFLQFIFFLNAVKL